MVIAKKAKPLLIAFAFATLLLLGVSCNKQECVDCSDKNGSVFTFCDPAESPIDSLTCGEVYKK